MATKVAIAIMREQATKRILTAMGEIGKSTNVEAPIIPMHNRDKDYLHADQLKTVADFLESIQKSPATITDETFGAELARRMDEHGVTLNSTKADIVAFLEVYLGDAG